MDARTSTPQPIARLDLGDLADAVDDVLADLDGRDAVARMRGRDHTLWAEDPSEISDRLGWLDVAERMLDAGEQLDALAESVLADGFTHAVVMGMGGSSLFPEVLARTFGPGPGGGLHLEVLDSTDPVAVARVAGTVPAEHTLFIVSSKSGTTIETRSHLEFFWDRVKRPECFVAVTDPGSELAELARQRGFRAVFENPSDIGGRYSALSYFGLVPAAVAGIDWRGLVTGAVEATEVLLSGDPRTNPALLLGAVLGAAVRAGRDKVTIVTDPEVATFGLWLEQLLAESTGKDGTGIVPIVDEPLGSLDAYGPDRIFVTIGEVDHPSGPQVMAEADHLVVQLSLGEPLELGVQVLLWEVATAVAGAVLGINPFDQPNVAEAKAATSSVLDGSVAVTGVEPVDAEGLARLLADRSDGDYLALQIYVDPESEAAAEAQDLRVGLRDRLGLATTLGIGPRFLHSTGQLHKGGPHSGIFLQVVTEAITDASIPGTEMTFGRLLRAQADGDLMTLRAHGLRAVRTTLEALGALEQKEIRR